MDDPLMILEILEEAERSLKLAKQAYSNRTAVELLQNLILCSAAAANALAIVALNKAPEDIIAERQPKPNPSLN
jgi:hypothetical protein